METLASSTVLGSLLTEVSALANRLKGPASDETRYGGLATSTRMIARSLRDDGPQTVPRIARARQTSRQNIQIAVNRLKKDGYVELITNPEHKRSLLVRLTEQGRRVLAGADEDDARFAGSLAGQITESELASAAALLRQLRAQMFGAAQQSPEARPRFAKARRQNKSPRQAAREASGWPPLQSSSSDAPQVMPVEEMTEGTELPVSLL
jgi:DNA-binding MarR family transcriptional regulator